MKRKLLLLITSLSMATSGWAQFTVWEFGESTDYTTGGPGLRLASGAEAAVGDTARAFSTNVMSPDPSSGPGYTGPTFYGGWEIKGAMTSLDFPMQVNDQSFAASSINGGFDALLFPANLANNGSLGEMNILIMADTSAPLTMGSLLSFEMSGRLAAAAGGVPYGSLVGSAVIRSGGTYYIGATASALMETANPPGYSPVGNFLPSDWLVYDPASSLDGRGVVATLSGSAPIEAVGFLLEVDAQRSALGESNVRPYIGKLAVTAVPEPSTYALLGGLLALGVVLVRRRNRYIATRR